MATEKPRLAVVVASVREARFGPTVARWFADTAAAADQFETDVIDLADHPEIVLAGARLDFGPETADAYAALGERLAAADAYVVVTPEYNHSYPAGLKAVIDGYKTQWQAKPIGFVSYGGVSGGLRAVEHLRLVYAELHAVTLRDTVSFHGAAATFGPDGAPLDQAGPAAAAKVLLDHLSWWAVALREAREKHPYGA